MNKQSVPSTKGKEVVVKREFGRFVDYFLFGLQSDSSFLPIATQLGVFFHCTLTMLKKFSTTIGDYNAQFPLAFTQFNFHKELNSPEDLSVDRLNLLLFQNKTTEFDKSKSPIAQKGNGKTFDFVDDTLGCYAVNSRGIYLRRSKIRDVDYFVMGYTKKGKDISPFLNFLQKFPRQLEDFSEYIIHPSKTTADVVLLRNLFFYAEAQIDETMKKNAENSRFVRA